MYDVSDIRDEMRFEVSEGLLRNGIKGPFEGMPK